MFAVPSCFNKAKSESNAKKTSSSAPWLLKYKTVEEKWIEESLVAFNTRIWQWEYDKDGEYATNHSSKVCTKLREHIEGIKYFKGDWITRSTNYCSHNTINHREGVSHKKKLFCF